MFFLYNFYFYVCVHPETQILPKTVNTKEKYKVLDIKPLEYVRQEDIRDIIHLY